MGIFTALLFISLHWTGSGSKTYAIYKGDDIIGTIKAHENRVKDSLIYEVTSEVTYHSLLYNLERSTLTKVSYCKNIMCGSKAFIVKNGETEEDCFTRLKNGTYFCQATDGDITTIDQNIYWTTSMMYFKEPVNAKFVFAEAYQELCPIAPTEKPHVYELTLPGNKKNEYVYEKGQLKEVNVHRTLVNLAFKLQP